MPPPIMKAATWEPVFPQCDPAEHPEPEIGTHLVDTDGRSIWTRSAEGWRTDGMKPGKHLDWEEFARLFAPFTEVALTPRPAHVTLEAVDRLVRKAHEAVRARRADLAASYLEAASGLVQDRMASDVKDFDTSDLICAAAAQVVREVTG